MRIVVLPIRISRITNFTITTVIVFYHYSSISIYITHCSSSIFTCILVHALSVLSLLNLPINHLPTVSAILFHTFLTLITVIVIDFPLYGSLKIGCVFSGLLPNLKLLQSSKSNTILHISNDDL